MAAIAHTVLTCILGFSFYY